MQTSLIGTNWCRKHSVRRIKITPTFILCWREWNFLVFKIHPISAWQSSYSLSEILPTCIDNYIIAVNHTARRESPLFVQVFGQLVRAFLCLRLQMASGD